MSATTNFRQRHNDTKGVCFMQEKQNNSNPSLISILITKPNAKSDKEVKK